MKKHYKPKTVNITKLKSYLETKPTQNKNDRSKRYSTSNTR